MTSVFRLIVGFILTGASGHDCVILASSVPVNWVPLQTNAAPFEFVDANPGSCS
jgi:hypothetical protein